MTELRESRQLIQVLKRCLKMKGITYKDLSLALDLSESSIKRLFATSNLTMQRFEQICEVLGMSFFDIASMTREEVGDLDRNTLSNEQEKALADDLNLFIGFHLILNGWSFAKIKNAFTWTEPEIIKIFTGLDKLRLITLLPGNRVKLHTATSIRWRKDGAIRKKYEKHVFSDFLNDDFKEENKFLDFELLELSDASTKILIRKLENLLREVHELATMDHSVKQSEKKSTGIMLGLRPWFFSLAIDSMTESYKQNRVGFHEEHE